jgi:hypothetical protein
VTILRNISPPYSGSKFRLSGNPWRTRQSCLLPASSSCWLMSQAGFELGLLSASYWFLVWLILRIWSWRWYFPPKRPFAFNMLHEVIYQKIELFITKAARSSNYARILSFKHEYFKIWERRKGELFCNIYCGFTQFSLEYTQFITWKIVKIRYRTIRN